MELFQVHNADNNSYPVVVSIPHSGRYIPVEIRKRFNDNIILPNMDWYLDVFYAFFETLGVSMIIANYSRYVIDLNRGLYLKGETGNYTGTLIYDKTTFEKDIYKIPPLSEDITNRITNYYLPYYTQLEELVTKKMAIFEKVYLLDLHSFYYQTDLDICLGTVDGITASSSTLSWIKNNLTQEGFSVDENNVFRGGHCIRHFREKFSNHLEAVALELRYTAYLENRYFGEEEVIGWNKELFSLTQDKMKNAFSSIFKRWG